MFNNTDNFGIQMGERGQTTKGLVFKWLGPQHYMVPTLEYLYEYLKLSKPFKNQT